MPAGITESLSSLVPITIEVDNVPSAATKSAISDKSCQVLTWIISDFFQGTH